MRARWRWDDVDKVDEIGSETEWTMSSRVNLGIVVGVGGDEGGGRRALRARA
jgi:hypothetical protein